MRRVFSMIVGLSLAALPLAAAGAWGLQRGFASSSSATSCRTSGGRW